MNFSKFLKTQKVYLDGGMGTLLQKEGLMPGELPERWNLTHADTVKNIHRAYYEAGSNVVSSNTFGANILKYSHAELEEIIKAALCNVRKAREEAAGSGERFVALDIGPTGRLLKPLGDLDFEDAVSVFAETVKLGVNYGAELIIIETMNDSYETKAALLAAKENSSLPVIVTNAYGSDGKLMTGATPSAMVAMLEGMGADAVGANCSLGPRQLMGVAEELLRVSSVPVVMKPNAGLPSVADGETVYDVDAEGFSDDLASLMEKGVRVVGGCCGTTPEYIKALYEKTKNIEPTPLTEKNLTAVSSYTHAVTFGERPILIGERINPTGKKRLKAALVERDFDYILGEAVSQEEKGADILDVNAGLPDIDEVEMLTEAVCEIQAVTALPLQIDTSNVSAMEAALRRYNGKAMINSVNGKEESMTAVFPLVAKYGGLLVALTLDESGIPDTAEGRFKIAERILKRAGEYGIKPKDIIFDTLAMTISADTSAALATLGALERIKKELGCHTSLGVSNVSFGLPVRDAVNSTFFAMALTKGLSAAIMNPYSSDMMKTYYSFCALSGLDENCMTYIGASDSFATASAVNAPASQTRSAEEYSSALQSAIAKGLRERAGELTALMLCDRAPLDIVNSEIIPALNSVGKGFEEKRIYLPQLLMSAEAAKAAFEVIKAHMAESGSVGTNKGTVIIATVHGDIHDIGKNIVKLLLENYGFDVVDMGKDVPPEEIAAKAEELKAPLVGLSALMTTTVPAMETTIRLLRERVPSCKVVVGGAVLTAEYAARIGADKYSSDAMETVRYAEEVLG